MPTIPGSTSASKNSSLWDLGTSNTSNAQKTDAMTNAEKVADAARGFETTLVRQMLKEVHNSPFNPKEGATRNGYLEMVDDQMAASITRGDGLGFAKKMTEQLLRQSQIAKQMNVKN
jgi:Rod binding domain-containing protein